MNSNLPYVWTDWGLVNHVGLQPVIMPYSFEFQICAGLFENKLINHHDQVAFSISKDTILCFLIGKYSITLKHFIDLLLLYIIISTNAL